MKNTNWKLPLIIIASAFAVIIAVVFWVQSAQDRAYALEEHVKTARKSLDNELKEREDLVYNLADCVLQYDNHELLYVELANARSSGNIENVEAAIDVVVEAYPELKSAENYKSLMLSLEKLESKIKTHRDNYDYAIEDYNKYTRTFMNRMRLNWLGYKRIEFPDLELNVKQDAPKNLFNK